MTAYRAKQFYHTFRLHKGVATLNTGSERVTSMLWLLHVMPLKVRDWYFLTTRKITNDGQ